MASEKLVLYFFQGELCESQDTPNAVVVPFQGKNITFEHFRSAFPRKYNLNNLHFRFKKEDSQLGYVWLDVRNPGDILPTCGGSIMAKILKLDDLTATKRKTRLRRRVNADSGMEGVAANAANASRSGSKADNRYEDEEEVDEREEYEAPEPSRSTVTSAAAPVKPAATSSSSGASSAGSRPGATTSSASQSAPAKSPVSPSPAPAPVRVANLLDDSDAVEATVPPPAPAVDMMNFGEVSPTVASSKTGSGVASDDIDEKAFGTGGLTREQLAARREAEIEAKVKAAREFKDDCDEKARNIAEEVEAAKAKYDKLLDAWATNNKEKRNVRTLLTTMHTVLWPENNWKPIGLGDVIEASKVKLQYRKAMLVVHPDKCSNKSPEIQFIAKRLFEAINEAYQEFLKKEGA